MSLRLLSVNRCKSSTTFPRFSSLLLRHQSTTTLTRPMASLKRKAGAPTDSPTDSKKQKQGSLTSFFGAPKPAATSSAPAATKTAPPPVKFDKEKWEASLSTEQKSLLKLEIDTLDPSWLAHLKDDLTSSYFLDLKRYLQKELDSGKKIFPPLEEVYSWYVHHPTPFRRQF